MSVVSLPICPKFAPLFTDELSTIVMDSGRTTGKTTTTEEAVISDMRVSPLNNVMYCRADRNDLNRCFGSMLVTMQMMGVADEFASMSSPFKIWHKKSGATCYFLGINGKVEEYVNATKGFVPARASLKYFIIDECQEVRSKAHIEGARSTANKFLLPNGKTIFMLNPPPTKQHYIHDFVRNEIANGAIRIYTTWKDIRELLKATTIAEIEKMERNNPLLYRYWYLGEVVNLAGLVYPQLKREKHVVNFWNLIQQGDFPTELVIGLDEGTKRDSTCATPLVIMASGKAVVVDLYEYSPTDRTSQQGESGVLSPSEQARRLFHWLQTLFERFPNLARVPRTWIFECAEGGQQLNAQFVQDYGEVTVFVKKKSIWGDVKRVRNMLSEGLLYFHVAPDVNTETLLSDMENYIIDEKTNDIKKNQREDSIDSLEYATKLYFDRPIARRTY